MEVGRMDAWFVRMVKWHFLVPLLHGLDVVLVLIEVQAL
jgi:hypothetical protein